MSAAAEPLLITVEQYRALPPREDVIQELQHGQVVSLCRPKMKHVRLQARLGELLRAKAQHLGVVESEVPFRALPEYELRGADVAFVSRARWDATSDEDNLRGSPELVIEVLSPSNTTREIRERKGHCCAPPIRTGTPLSFGRAAQNRARFARGLQIKASLCLGTGCREFWVVDPDRKTITVTEPEQQPVVYPEGDAIPLKLFGGELSVSQVFASTANL